MNEISQRLRVVVSEIRRKPYPICDLIPLLNMAADEIDKLELMHNSVYNQSTPNFT